MLERLCLSDGCNAISKSNWTAVFMGIVEEEDEHEHEEKDTLKSEVG